LRAQGSFDNKEQRTLGTDTDELDVLGLDVLKASVQVLNLLEFELGLLVGLGEDVLVTQDFEQVVEQDTISEVHLEVVDAQRPLGEVVVAPAGEGLGRKGDERVPIRRARARKCSFAYLLLDSDPRGTVLRHLISLEKQEDEKKRRRERGEAAAVVSHFERIRETTVISAVAFQNGERNEICFYFLIFYKNHIIIFFAG